MVTYCTTCGAVLPEQARFCGGCGSVVARDTAQADAAPVDEAQAVAGPVPPAYVPPSPLAYSASAATPYPKAFEEGPSTDSGVSRKWLIGGILGAVALLGGLYYWLFLSDDVAQGGTPTVQAAPVVAEVAKQFYTVTEANIRDNATATGSNITGKLPRGTAVSGRLALGADGISNWLELADDKGFVGAVNLSETQPPVLTKLLADKIWAADKPLDIWAQPEASSSVIDHVAVGTKLTLAGLTANDYIEIKLQKGGVGYIAEGARILALSTAKPVTISFNPNSCNFGGEIETLFTTLQGQHEAKRDVIASAKYPNDDAKQAALDKYDAAHEDDSSFMKLQRSFSGLTVSGIAQHYESQSIYFTDPPAKVIEAFKGLGFKLGKDGAFQTGDLYAGITPASGKSGVYGKTELSCGV